jgi:hypothetical protein
MLFPLTSSSISLTLYATSAAHIMLNPQAGPPNQQPLQQSQAVLTLTMTLRTTVTSYVTTSTTTEPRTRYTMDGTTDVPKVVQAWYAAQKAEGCDRTACASCRVWYECEGFGSVW